MTRVTVLAVILGLGVAFMVTAMPTPAHAQGIGQDICLARWVWNTDDVPYWEPPFSANHIGTLDMRSLPEHAAGPVALGWGLFSYDIPMGITTMHCLGGDLNSSMTTSQVNTLAVLLGLSMGDISARNMRGVIAELFLQQGDPTGVLRWKPLQTTRKGLVIHLGGYGQIYGEPFSETSRATQNTLDVRWADYRRAKAEGVPLPQLRRETGFSGFTIFGREPTPSDLNRLLPPEYRSDGHSCSNPSTCTTITESFNTADSDILGPDLTWTELGGTDIDIVGNHAEAASTEGYARAESALAGADMYGQALVTNLIDGTFRGPGPCVRYAAAADTAYFVIASRTGGVFDAYTVVVRT